MQSVLFSPMTLLFFSVFALYVIQLPHGPAPLWRRVVFWAFLVLLVFAFVLTLVAHEPGIRTYRW